MTPIASAKGTSVSDGGVSQAVLAQPTQLEARTLEPSQLNSRVSDASGVLTPEQAAELEDSLNQIVTAHHRSIFLVFMPSFGAYSNTQWTELAVEANGGGNTLVLAVATEDRQYGLTADVSAGYWSDAELDAIDSAIFPSLANSNWAGVGYAAVEEVRVAIPTVEETAAESQGEQEGVQALPRLLDSSGALTPEEFTELEGMLVQFETEHQRPISIVYVPSLEDESWLQWIDQLNAIGQDLDPLAVVMLTDTFEYNVASITPSNNWSKDEVDYVKSEVKTAINETGWFGAGRTAVESAAASIEKFRGSSDEAAPGRSSSQETSSSFGLLLSLLFLFLSSSVLILGLPYLNHRKNRSERREKKKEYEASLAKDLATARSLSPQDRVELDRLPINTLETRADELIVEIDEALQNATDELRHAEAEFGSLRTHELREAVESVDATLQQAYLTRKKINDAAPAGKMQKPPIIIRLNNWLHRSLEKNQTRTEAAPDSEPQTRPVFAKMTAWVQKEYQEWQDLLVEEPVNNPQKRAMLVETITSCGRALELLRGQLAQLAGLRSEIARSDTTLSELTKRSVSLRTRFIAAEITWDGLKKRYSPKILASIDHNIEVAGTALDEANKQIDYAREQQTMPVGQQGALIGAMRAVDRALGRADHHLLGIEHAENSIAAARDELLPLIQEVRDEIADARQLKAQGAQEGMPADWDVLESAVNDARILVERAETEGGNDPLGAYTDLLKAETSLGEQLDAVRQSIAARNHQLAMLDQQRESTRVRIQTADDLISSRGTAIQVHARTLLVNAKELNFRALELRQSQTSEAMEYARQAAHQADWALRQAQQDIDVCEEQTESSESPGRAEKPGSGSSSNFLRGLVTSSFFGSSASYGQATGRDETTDERRERLQRERKRQREEEERRERYEQRRREGRTRDSGNDGYSSRGGSF